MVLILGMPEMAHSIHVVRDAHITMESYGVHLGLRNALGWSTWIPWMDLVVHITWHHVYGHISTRLHSWTLPSSWVCISSWGYGLLVVLSRRWTCMLVAYSIHVVHDVHITIRSHGGTSGTPGY